MWRIQYRHVGRNARVFTSNPVDTLGRNALLEGFRECKQDGLIAWYRVLPAPPVTRSLHRKT